MAKPFSLALALLGTLAPLGWGRAVHAFSCPPAAPRFQLVYSPLPTGGIALGPSLLSPTDQHQQTQLQHILQQDGLAAAQPLIATMAPAVAADTLAALGSVPAYDRPADGDAMVEQAIALLLTAPDSALRDRTLYYATRAVAMQGNWAAATQAVQAIRDVQLRVGTHQHLALAAQRQGLPAQAQQQRQQVAAFIHGQPAYQAVFWANLAATAQASEAPDLATTYSTTALAHLGQISDSRRSELVYAGTAHPDAAPAQVARALAAAHQFAAATALIDQLSTDATGPRLALAAHQIAAGLPLAEVLPAVVTITERSAYRETLDLALALAQRGDIDCSVAVAIPSQLDGRALSPLPAPLPELLHQWAIAGRWDALLALGADADPQQRPVNLAQLAQQWGQMGTVDPALALAQQVPSPADAYRILLFLQRGLIEGGNRAAAAQVQPAIDELLANAAAARAQAETWRDDWAASEAVPDYGPWRSLPQGTLYAPVQGLLQGPAPAASELLAARAALLASALPPDRDQVALLGEVALALYHLGDETEATATLAAAQTQAATLDEQPTDRLDPTLAHLVTRYRRAGWYTGAAAWLVHPVVGITAQPQLIALDLPPSPQGQAVQDLAEVALAQGANQAAIDGVFQLGRPADQGRMGAAVAAAAMNNRAAQVLPIDPTSAFVQLDVLADRVVPVVEGLPPGLERAWAYRAVAEGYIALGETATARDWLQAAANLAAVNLADGPSGQGHPMAIALQSSLQKL